MSRFDLFIEHVFRSEGGYVNDPLDNGGETKYGITKLTARAYGYNGDMRALVKAEAMEIYRKGYWNVLYDKIKSVDIAFKLFDLGINCGIATTVKRVQIVCQRNIANAPGQISKVDGQFGPKTLASLNQRIDEKGAAFVLDEFTALMSDYYKEIVKNKPSQQRFIKGWLMRLSRRPHFEETNV